MFFAMHRSVGACLFFLISLINYEVECGSYFEKIKVPKFSTEGESGKDLLAQWQMEAVSNLMAAHATQLQKHLTEREQRLMEKCAQNAIDFFTYAVCFKPLWAKEKKLRRRKRSVVVMPEQPSFVQEEEPQAEIIYVQADDQVDRVNKDAAFVQDDEPQFEPIKQRKHSNREDAHVKKIGGFVVEMADEETISLYKPNVETPETSEAEDVRTETTPFEQMDDSMKPGDESSFALEIAKEEPSSVDLSQMDPVVRMQLETVARSRVDTSAAIDPPPVQLQSKVPNEDTFESIFDQNVPLETSMLGDVADWIGGVVHAIKEPKVIGDGKFIRPSDREEEKLKKKNGTVKQIENILEGTLVGQFVKDLFAPVEGLSDLISSKVSNTTANDLKRIVKRHIKETEVTGMKENLPNWQFDFVQDSQKMFLEMANVSDEYESKYFLSPRLFPVSKQQPGQRFLSPDILGFNEGGEDSIAPLPDLMNNMKPGDKKAWLNFIMEASGVSDMTKNAGGLNELLKQKDEEEQLKSQENPIDTRQLYGEKFDKYQESFKQLYASMDETQVQHLADRGYSFMTEGQLETMYGNETVFEPVTFNKTLYNSMTEEELFNSLTDYFEAITDQMLDKRRRTKRLVLTPLLFTPVILYVPAILVLNPLILSPLLFSPIILSPIVLGPIILSPLLFSPIILSPVLLSPLVLSPALFDPFILSPLVLDPIILSPLLFDPLILSPVLLSPIVLSPALFTPFILSPLALGGVILSPLLGDAVILSPLLLFPIVLSPVVLNPFVLSPLALTPVILSPLLLSPLILTPIYLSPIIRSPIVSSPIILSPIVMSPIIKSPLVNSPVITGKKPAAAQVLSPQFLSPNIESPKRNFNTLLSPSILSRRKRNSSASLVFPFSFITDKNFYNQLDSNHSSYKVPIYSFERN